MNKNVAQPLTTVLIGGSPDDDHDEQNQNINIE